MYDVPDQAGKLAVVTGANSGTGKEATKRLAAAGARVIMAVRTPAKGEAARAEILAEHPDAQLEVRRIDLADLASVQEFADGLAADEPLADLMMSNHLAKLSADRGWGLLSVAAHPGFTRTNLQTAGASLGRERPSRLTHWGLRFNPLPTQGVEVGTEPLLFAATGPDAQPGAYYGPSGRLGLVGPTTLVKAPKNALDPEANARLWSVAEGLTGVSLPASGPILRK